MPKAKYQGIYHALKSRVEAGDYRPGELLPPENTLIEEFDCSRNTVRRAIAELIKDGYVQARQGKGVCCIFQPVAQSAYSVGAIESFRESAERNGKTGKTRVLRFAELTADEALARRTGFAPGTALFYLLRLHLLDGKPLILNHNYFLRALMPGLTAEIASQSIYRYLEQELAITIVTSKRTVTVERATPLDESCMELGDCNCLAVISSQTYNSEGIMFEYTQSRHHPDYFRFQANAARRTV